MINPSSNLQALSPLNPVTPEVAALYAGAQSEAITQIQLSRPTAEGPKVLIDLDGVLFDWLTPFSAFLVEEFGQGIFTHPDKHSPLRSPFSRADSPAPY